MPLLIASVQFALLCCVRFFLTLLALASQRFEYIVLSILCYFLPDVELLTDTKHHWEVIFIKSSL